MSYPFWGISFIEELEVDCMEYNNVTAFFLLGKHISFCQRGSIVNTDGIGASGVISFPWLVLVWQIELKTPACFLQFLLT